MKIVSVVEDCCNARKRDQIHRIVQVNKKKKKNVIQYLKKIEKLECLTQSKNVYNNTFKNIFLNCSEENGKATTEK